MCIRDRRDSPVNGILDTLVKERLQFLLHLGLHPVTAPDVYKRQEQLKTRKYKPQPVRRVEIPKPDGGTRKLGVPTVVDRFVQQAVLKAIEMMNDGHNWIVDIDLAKFFDTVDHDKMMTSMKIQSSERRREEIYHRCLQMLC